uniref:Uncharacterized protein n=1 Tax=Arundo donax TaxID=35708 RepID=A0A0A9E6C9_ARUDO
MYSNCSLTVLFCNQRLHGLDGMNSMRVQR